MKRARSAEFQSAVSPVVLNPRAEEYRALPIWKLDECNSAIPRRNFRLDCVDGRFCQYTFIEKSASSLSCPSNQALAVLAVVIIFVALCFRLGYLPLLAPDEGRNAEVGHEMKASGSWLVPTYNGVDYLDKPAFYFKLVALSLGLFGHNEAAARLPSAAFAVALTALVFAFCRKVHGTRCGLLAAIVVGTTPLFMVIARTVIFDMMLAFFVCGAIFAGYLAETSGGQGAAELVSAWRGVGGLGHAGERAGGFPDPGAGAADFQSGRRPARRVETVVRAVEFCLVLGAHAAVVRGTLSRAPGLSPLRAGGGIVQAGSRRPRPSNAPSRFISFLLIIAGHVSAVEPPAAGSELWRRGRSAGRKTPRTGFAWSGRWWWWYFSPSRNRSCRATS